MKNVFHTPNDQSYLRRHKLIDTGVLFDMAYNDTVIG